MRRIYESDALSRDDDEPFSPNEEDASGRPQAIPWIDSTRLSRLLVPKQLRYRAIGIDVSTPRTEFPVGEPVPFTVTMKNAMPFPVTIPTLSPLLWTWDVDGVPEASHVALRDPPDERGSFRFDRGERKRFRKRWTGMFRVSDSEWEPVDPGEYTIGAGLNVDDSAVEGLYDETTIRLVPE